MKLENNAYAELLLPDISVSDSEKCIAMDVLHASGHLRLWVKHISEHPARNANISAHLVWLQSSQTDVIWAKIYIQLEKLAEKRAQPLLQLEGYNTLSSNGKVALAIDNVNITNGPCINAQGK